ncbi:hypothetical protein DFJ58DRAFT_716186 [Suillus subalutaceus]|uniref:uncharacterized protein n=1 Tax=Suillus subalutaceus TaxID=48586 RepID=UPI001B86C9CE|nr:uncharacterized protein DFJ58DRAFT_716186 [Suillus subalutaceus]KAG1855755.1 hypothetical protein DFJ58DRAFT_716186 [Suillus subalutaceus]
MPVTRSATRSVASTPAGGSNKTTTIVSPSAVGKSNKRKAAEETPAAKKTPRAKKTKSSDESAETPPTSNAFIPPPPPPLQTESEEKPLVPAALTFSFEEAKAHLIRADHRFEDIFTKLRCKPFELLEQVHPFRALVESILAQQISWLAARSIIHRFTRLYDPSLPEKVADYSASKSPTFFFPTPYQVANTDIVTLKSAGLSTRKAEYVYYFLSVKDLAARFADRRLSTENYLLQMMKSLAEMLIEVRGIGTLDMFAIFSSVVQTSSQSVTRYPARNVALVLSRHSSKHTGESNDDKTKQASTGAMGPPPTTPAPKMTPGFQLTGDVEPDNETLDADAMNTEPLPEGLSVADLKSRLERKKIKGAFLTPKEMEDLTRMIRDNNFNNSGELKVIRRPTVLLPVLRSKQRLIHFRRFDELLEASALLLLIRNSSKVRFLDVPTRCTVVSGLGEVKGGRNFRC